MTLRQVWRRLHLWIGLVCGLVFVLLGLTGSILVYQDELLDRLYPDAMHVTVGPELAPPSRLIAAAQAALPGVRVNTLRYPEDPSRALQAVMVRGNGSRETILLNPYTAAPIGPLPGAWLPVIADLHSRLLLAAMGRDIVGWLGVVFAISAITGIVLWWPLNWRNPRQWRQAFSLHWRNMTWFRRSFDLHKVGGAVIALPLLLLSLSGSAISFREPLLPVMTLFGGQPIQRPAATPAAGPALSVDDLAAEAMRLIPGARLVFVLPPPRPGGPTRIRLREPGEIHQNGRTYVLFDAAGNVLDMQRVSQLPAANMVFDQLPYPLHTGYLFGEAGRLAVFIAGILPALLFITGIVIWLQRRPAKRGARPA